MNKVVCITGLCGAGKSIVSDYLVNKKSFQFLRFGQITMDEVKKRGLPINEASEKLVREDIRKQHGMGAFALLNLSKLDELIKKGYVVGDGLYSFEEYKILKDHFSDKLIVIAVYAPPCLRYERISQRISDSTDTDLRHRSITVEEAKKRDIAELENLNKGATIAMADFTIQNTKDTNYLYEQIEEILISIS
jgi:dephospho-CoA kinase